MQFGPAAWQSRALGWLAVLTLRPLLGLLTLLGLAVNRIAPALLQRARLDVIGRGAADRRA